MAKKKKVVKMNAAQKKQFIKILKKVDAKGKTTWTDEKLRTALEKAVKAGNNPEDLTAKEEKLLALLGYPVKRDAKDEDEEKPAKKGKKKKAAEEDEEEDEDEEDEDENEEEEDDEEEEEDEDEDDSDDEDEDEEDEDSDEEDEDEDEEEDEDEDEEEDEDEDEEVSKAAKMAFGKFIKAKKNFALADMNKAAKKNKAAFTILLAAAVKAGKVRYTSAKK